MCRVHGPSPLSATVSAVGGHAPNPALRNRWKMMICFTTLESCVITLARLLFLLIASQNLFNNVTYMYPTANIWIVGHSLGGGLAGLIGATFGVPTITFEALGDRLAASRLHLPTPPPPPSLRGSWNPDHSFSLHPITHIYHTGDPVPHGTCTGVRSLCAKGGEYIHDA